jgi:hypothetical protein
MNYKLLDGKGFKSFIACTNFEEDFLNVFNGFNFIQEKGTSSDVEYLFLALKTVSVNIAVGYYQAHTENEYLEIP